MSTLYFPGQQTRGFDDVNLWFGFVAKEYSNRRVHRFRRRRTGESTVGSLRDAGRGDPLTSIRLPMPVNLAAKLNVTYTNQRTTQSPFGEAFADLISFISGGERSGRGPLDRFGNIAGAGIAEALDLVGGTFPFGIVETDMNDATFGVANGRTFTFRYAMIAKDELQAADIAEICQKFKIHALPTQTDLRPRVQAPPLWSWTAYKKIGPSDDTQILKASDTEQQVWTDDAQASVLTSVDIDRTGAGGVHPINVGGDKLLPIVTTLTLTFVEIEPLITVDTVDLITNRSGAQISFTDNTVIRRALGNFLGN